MEEAERQNGQFAKLLKGEKGRKNKRVKFLLPFLLIYLSVNHYCIGNFTIQRFYAFAL